MKGFSEGGVDYLSKPFQAEEILARVNTHITLYALQRNLEEKNIELEKALDQVEELRGMLPICANCKDIRDDQGYWRKIEEFITNHSKARFSHSICPTCVEILYPELHKK